MSYDPDQMDVKDIVSANIFAIRITDLNAIGDPSGGPTTELVSVGAIIGSPEGRLVGSPGDVVFRQDVPQIWQKGSGERTRLGWALIAGAATGSCPTTVLTVGPGCQFEEIQPAIDFAAAELAPALDQNVVVQVAPGVYNENLTLRPFVQVEGIGDNLPVTVLGNASVEINTGNPFSSFILRDITLTPPVSPGASLTISGTDSISVNLERVQLTGPIVYNNSNPDSELILERSQVNAGAVPAAITMAGNADSQLTLEYSAVSVGLPGANISINMIAGRLVSRYSDIDGVVDFNDNTTGLILFTQINGDVQEAMLIGNAASVEVYNSDMRSNEPGGSVIAGGGGTLEFANMTLSGTAKDYTGATPTDQSEAYFRASAADWNNNSPLTVKDALDRLAAFVGPVT